MDKHLESTLQQTVMSPLLSPLHASPCFSVGAALSDSSISYCLPVAKLGVPYTSGLQPLPHQGRVS